MGRPDGRQIQSAVRIVFKSLNTVQVELYLCSWAMWAKGFNSCVHVLLKIKRTSELYVHFISLRESGQSKMNVLEELFNENLYV